MRKPYTLSWNGRTLALGARTCIMGVLNVTPDSFSDGGRFFAIDRAVAHGERLAAEGADILDIGGESTRPFSESVPAEAEIRRVIPVIEKLAGRIRIPISIDTTKAAVARRALDAGAAIINDVSALRMDPEIAGVAAAAGVPVILMHMLGTPKTMQKAPAYDDLLGEVNAFLADAKTRATDAGISPSHIIVDPGIGFGKTLTHNLELIRGIGSFDALSAPILIGPSRKAFIRTLLQGGCGGAEVTPEMPAVETGTQAAVAAAIVGGAHMVRVHNVANARATAAIADAIVNAGSGCEGPGANR